MQPKQNRLILREDENVSNYFRYYKEENYILGNKKQNIEKDHIDLINKSLNFKNVKIMLFRYIP